MRKSGQVALIQFPQTDLSQGKLRPVLLVAPLPGKYGDWLICMISTQLRQAIAGFDEVIDKDSPDFHLSGLKVPSLVRAARLAVVAGDILIGSLGEISSERLQRIQENLSSWIKGKR